MEWEVSAEQVVRALSEVLEKHAVSTETHDDRTHVGDGKDDEEIVQEMLLTFQDGGTGNGADMARIRLCCFMFGRNSRLLLHCLDLP